ncbi:plasma-membrane choline transporter-domain-containing protein [Gautieria morchelliformis]|nr:plasma-membrane choline transporter-domain-containing protein [Gautieria morchelliformis]
MTSPFSQYASKFLNARLGPSASLESSQPLFYSFQESSEGEGSIGRLRTAVQSRDDLELDDHGEPRLRGDEDVDNPYLRLDEDDGDGTLRESPRLIASEVPSTQGGWLAHQTSPLPSRSPTPTPPSSEGSSPRNPIDPQPSIRAALTETLLPRDGISRSVFFLPDPGRTSRHRYNDATWTVLWCTALLISFLASLLSLFLTQSPSFPTPFSTLTQTIPLLTIFTVLCTCLSYTHTLLLRYFTRPMLIATTLFIPIALILSALSAFSGSFIYDGPKPATWGTTIGLRIFSLLPLAFALLASRSLLSSIPYINRTASTVHLATSLLLSNPPLLAISPALLFAALLATLPFLSLIFRLLLVGYYRKEEWHVQPYAIWLAMFTCLVWIWSWCVVRGILRVTAAGIVGAWFFEQRDPVGDPIPGQLQASRAALARAWGPCIGTICLSALIQTFTGSILFLLRGIRRLTSPSILPEFLHPLSIPIVLLSKSLTPYTFSGYTLPYAGLTGDAFFPSSRRAHEITSIKRAHIAPPSYTLLSTLLTLSSLSLGILLALCSYLFIAHVLLRPEHAYLGALLTGAMTFLVTWFCGGIIGDTADALYVCYCLDREAGTGTRQEVIDAFEGPRPPGVV